MVSGHSLRIHKYYSEYRGSDSMFLEKIELDKPIGYKTMNIYSELHFTSQERGKFAEAISLAMNNPEEGNNLYSGYPEGCEEVTL